jgi:hypothetical protein
VCVRRPLGPRIERPLSVCQPFKSFGSHHPDQVAAGKATGEANIASVVDVASGGTPQPAERAGNPRANHLGEQYAQSP